MPSNDYTVTVTPAGNNITLSTQTLGPAGPPGSSGTSGSSGINGIGVPVDGTVNQVLAKASSTNYDVAINTINQSRARVK
jgi:hypothetical protein